MKELKTFGDWTNFMEKYTPNMSTIYTELIKEAALCENYSSDVLIDIERFEECLKECQSGEQGRVFFGFRDMGVDGLTYISCNLSHLESSYRKIAVLEYSKYKVYDCDSIGIKMTIYESEEFEKVKEIFKNVQESNK